MCKCANVQMVALGRANLSECANMVNVQMCKCANGRLRSRKFKCMCKYG